jgi:hypothetical protein
MQHGTRSAGSGQRAAPPPRGFLYSPSPRCTEQRRGLGEGAPTHAARVVPIPRFGLHQAAPRARWLSAAPTGPEPCCATLCALDGTPARCRCALAARARQRTCSGRRGATCTAPTLRAEPPYLRRTTQPRPPAPLSRMAPLRACVLEVAYGGATAASCAIDGLDVAGGCCGVEVQSCRAAQPPSPSPRCPRSRLAPSARCTGLRSAARLKCRSNVTPH